MRYTVQAKWRPGKHLGEYSQMIVAAIKVVPLDPTALFEQVVRDRDNPQPLTVQPEPVYRLRRWGRRWRGDRNRGLWPRRPARQNRSC